MSKTSITKALKNKLTKQTLNAVNLSPNSQEGWASHQERVAFEADKIRSEANRYGAPFFL